MRHKVYKIQEKQECEQVMAGCAAQKAGKRVFPSPVYQRAHKKDRQCCEQQFWKCSRRRCPYQHAESEDQQRKGQYSVFRMVEIDEVE